MLFCAIVGAGDFYPEHFDKSKYGFIIAADGGVKSLEKIGITPDLIVGDLDSSDRLPAGVPLVKFKVEKDETDMHLALLEGAKRGYRGFVLFGGVGGRIDHTFANYCLLKYAKEQGYTAYLIDKDYYSFVIKNEERELLGRRGAAFSVFAFGTEAGGVSVRGGKYAAEDVTLSPDFPLGVSNSFTGGPVSISVTDGSLLVMAEYPEKNSDFY